MSKFQLLDGLVRRQKQIENVLSLLEDVRRGKKDRTVLEIYGVPGIGKTILAGQLSEELDNRGVLCAHLDFERAQEPSTRRWKFFQNFQTQGESSDLGLKLAMRRIINIIAKIFRFLQNKLTDKAPFITKQGQLGSENVSAYFNKPQSLFHDLLSAWEYLGVPDLRKDILTLKQAPATDQKHLKNQLADSVVNRVGSLKANEPIVLLCDETDKIQYENLRWFEEHIIEPLVQSENCLIIWFGRRKELSLREGIKRFVVTCPLEEFKVPEIDLHLQYNKVNIANVPPDRLFLITGGHPMAGDVAIKYLKDHASIDLDYVQDELIELIGQKVVEEYILRDIDRSKFDLKSWLTLSIPRAFDPKILKALLSPQDVDSTLIDYGPNLYQQFQINEMTEQMKLPEVTSIDPERKYYRLAKPVRGLMHRYYRVLDLEGYCTDHKIMQQVYQRRLGGIGPGKSLDEWDSWALEYLYHTACIDQVRTYYNLQDELVNILQKRKKFGKEKEELQKILRQLVSRIEKDVELEQLIGKVRVDELLSILRGYL